MEPLVQTLQVVAELDVGSDGALLSALRGQSEQLQGLVPDIVGMSVGTIEDNLTLTWAATTAELAILDLSRSLVGGVDGHRRRPP